MDDNRAKILEQIKQREIERNRQMLMKTLEKHGTLHPTFGREDIVENITQDKLDEVDRLAKAMAEEQYPQTRKIEHPTFGSTEETVRIERPSKTNLASQLDDLGLQGSILKEKLQKAGINAEKIKDISELGPVRSEPYIIPPEERARMVDVGALKKAEANKAALQKLGKAATIGGIGLGSLATAKDLSEGDLVKAGIDVAETGLGLAGGGLSRVAPLLELLRSTPTQTEEQEQEELAKYRRLNNMLTNSKKDMKRNPASE